MNPFHTEPVRVYIAGPMSGLPEFNYPSFHAAEEWLIARGYVVENPARPGQVEGWGWLDYMRRAIGQLITCDTVLMLDGWQDSPGARIEERLARELRMPIWTQRSIGLVA